MSTPYLGSLTLVPFYFAPKGFALCNGQLLPINTNQALFALLGTTYGGNGTTTFALPNLQGRIAIGVGGGYVQGQTDGSESVALTAQQMPAHVHSLVVSSASGPLLPTLSGNTVVVAAGQNYASSTDGTSMDPGSITMNGGGAAHENRSPFLVLNCVIALQGIFPSRS